MNSSVDNASVNVHECEKCLTLETGLLNKNDFIEKVIYDKLFKSFTTLEKRCISLEVDTQLNQEIFQRDNSVSNQSAPSFDQLFELNELKAQSQEKDTVIKKLKERIKSLSGKMNEDKIKKDLEEIETINIELDHRVSKLIAENEHLKRTYNLQEKVLVITALKDDLKKLKGKALVDNAVMKHTIDREMLKFDVEPITPKLLNKKTSHFAYIKHTQEEATVLRDLVEQVKSKYPLNHSLESACRYAKLIQELLTNICKTCLSINNTDGKLVAMTPKNKDKRVTFTEPVTSSGNTITKTASTSNLVSNKPMLSSTGVKSSTSASRSQPSGNTKKDKIQQTPSSTQTNKVEVHPRKVKSSLKNKDCVVAPKGTANVQHSKLNANFELKCVKPTGRTFSIVGNACPLTRITTTTEVPLRKPIVLDNEIPKPFVTLVYSRKPRTSKTNVTASKSKVIQIVLWYLDSGCSKHMNEDRSQLTNFVYKFLEELGHNLFSIMQLCDLNLEVAFRQHTYFIGNLEGVDLMTGFQGNNLYTLSLGDIMASSPICLLSKASKTKSWLWHRRLSHLNFAVINHLARHGLVRGLPKLKFEKDHLVNGKKYILVIVDDYSRFTWVKCLRSKDEAPDFIIKFLKMIQVRLKVPVRRIRTDNGTEFVNQTLREYYEKVGISHETSVARSPQQNGVVERRNRTLIEAARTMLIYAKAPLFLWAEAVATACYTQNRSIIRLRHGKTPYELLHDKLPDLSFFHVFGALCYPTNDSENLGKLQPKVDIDIDKLTAMASEHISSGPALHDDLLFQPLFDELLTPLPSVDHPAPEVIALIPEVVAPEPAASTGVLASTTVDQDAPSSSNSQTTPKTQSLVILNDVEEDNHDLDVAHMNNDPFFGIPIPENDSEASSSSDVIPTIVHTATPNSEHVTK
ncbi:retrovirus-related pol polyprotein from transposon TNT 1-94 [Tanacetum coccineum]